MVMSLGFVRRLSGTDQQYVYFPITSPISIQGQDNVVAPTLPGNTNTSLFGGSTSNNFLLHLGQARIVLRVEGILPPLAATDYPGNLGANHVYLYDATYAAPNGTAAAQTAYEIRQVMLKFWLDQGDTINYGVTQFGWPAWSATGTTSVNSQTVKLFEGYMTKPIFTETPGNPGKVDYSFEFVVGSI